VDPRFDGIKNLMDVDHLQRVRLFAVGGGRVGHAFLRLGVHHGIRHVRLIEPDTVSPRNFASGFPESWIGGWKGELVRTELKWRRKDVTVNTSRKARTTNDFDVFFDFLEWSTHVAFFIDSFEVVSALVRHAYALRPCVYAALLERGQVGGAAFSVPGQTPCLNCTARLFERQGVAGGETLLGVTLPHFMYQVE